MLGQSFRRAAMYSLIHTLSRWWLYGRIALLITWLTIRHYLFLYSFTYFRYLFYIELSVVIFYYFPCCRHISHCKRLRPSLPEGAIQNLVYWSVIDWDRLFSSHNVLPYQSNAVATKNVARFTLLGSYMYFYASIRLCFCFFAVLFSCILSL